MSDHPNVDKLADVDRLSQWRNERLEKAEADKQERLRVKALQRQTEQEKQKTTRMQSAKALLPTEAELAQQETLLLKQAERKMGWAFVQFLICVLLPLAAGIYYHTSVATPLYEAKAVVLVSKVSGTNENQQTGLLNSLATPSNLSEAFKADAFIQSQAMIDQLETDQGLLSRWSSEAIDPIQRLRSIDEIGLTRQMQTQRFLDSRVDVQTGLLTLEIRETDPARSIEIASLVLTLTAERLNELNERQFSTQIARADDAVEKAKTELVAAQNALAESQSASGEVDPQLSVNGAYEAIRMLEAQALELENEFNKAQIAGRGESYLAGRTKELAERTRAEIAERRSTLVIGDNGNQSLSTALMNHERASLQVSIAEKALENAFDNLAAATRAAGENQSLLQVIVPPSVDQTPTHPKGLSSLLLIAVVSLSVFAFLRLLQSGRRV